MNASIGSKHRINAPIVHLLSSGWYVKQSPQVLHRHMFGFSAVGPTCGDLQSKQKPVDFKFTPPNFRILLWLFFGSYLQHDPYNSAIPHVA